MQRQLLPTCRCDNLWLYLFILLLGVVAGKGPAAAEAGKAEQTGQILFGDLHVHTTFSIDAAMMYMPAFGGGGATSPMTACDFARYCSQLDFWSINDHAEFLTPDLWQQTKDAIRTCNERTGGNSADPDMVSFVGWEWTQMGGVIGGGAPHYGHKNVIFLDTADDKLPARPIASSETTARGVMSVEQPVSFGSFFSINLQADPQHAGYYRAVLDHMAVLREVPGCEAGVDTRTLPLRCSESALDPGTLFEKLDQWGFETLVIPHGNAWGIYSPALTNWKNQLNARHHDPQKQRLIEIYSGHGNSEEYRAWRPYQVVDGKNVCPAPTAEYLPCCWQAGEIVRNRTVACAVEPEGEACRTAVEKARADYMAADVRGYTTIANTQPEDWKDCGQCRDCFKPDWQYRPGGSVQAAFASTNFDNPDQPLNYRFGIIGSTDTHQGAPGVGYKEAKKFADHFGPAEPRFDQRNRVVLSELLSDWERTGSFWYTGALVAVHSPARDRRSIWEALKRREVYATSGPRILLWFDLVNGPDGKRLPMGSEVRLNQAPRFVVRALGAFKQQPGCPQETVAKAPAGFIERYCLGECYNPSDERLRIERIEIVRIRPQRTANEPLEDLIDDPWKVLPCPRGTTPCQVTFEDPEFVDRQRPTLYYARALQEETPSLNAGNLRCTYDAQGNCVAIRPCYSDYRGKDDECLTLASERAWSSPIFVDPAGAQE